MVSRRSFLKLLSAIPAVAALPAVAHAAEQLPETDDLVTTWTVDDSPLPDGSAYCDLDFAEGAVSSSRGVVRTLGTWLTINGVPVGVESMAIESDQEFIRFDSPYGSRMHPGIRTNRLVATLAGDSVALYTLLDAFLINTPLNLVARFGDCGEFHAVGSVLSYSIQFGNRVQAAAEFYLRDVEWVSK